MKHPMILALVAAAALAAGCSRTDGPDTRTTGERVDDAVVTAQNKTENAAERAGEKMERAGEVIADKAGDAAITAGVNAELAKDPALSALRIDVDTAGGKVVLRGNAPSLEARARATQLAQGVKGVTSVDNQLEVKS